MSSTAPSSSVPVSTPTPVPAPAPLAAASPPVASPATSVLARGKKRDEMLEIFCQIAGEEPYAMTDGLRLIGGTTYAGTVDRGTSVLKIKENHMELKCDEGSAPETKIKAEDNKLTFEFRGPANQQNVQIFFERMFQVMSKIGGEFDITPEQLTALKASFISKGVTEADFQRGLQGAMNFSPQAAVTPSTSTTAAAGASATTAAAGTSTTPAAGGAGAPTAAPAPSVQAARLFSRVLNAGTQGAFQAIVQASSAAAAP